MARDMTPAEREQMERETRELRAEFDVLAAEATATAIRRGAKPHPRVVNLRRGFSSPGFEQGAKSEYDAAADKMAEAMRAKRRELIAQPLDRIWDQLALAALSAITDET